VTVWAGTRIETIVAELYQLQPKRDLTCCPGVIGIQTIAGGISTGTHGQGMYQSTVSDCVLSLRIVDASGNVQVIDRSHENYGAYIMSLGTLGIITQVTLETRLARTFSALKYSVDREIFKQEYVKKNYQHEFLKAWWFPETGLVHIWEVNEATATEAEEYANGDGQLITTSVKVDDTMNESVDRAIQDMEQDTQTTKGRQFETVQRFKDATNVTGSLTQILCKGIPVPQINCEIAIPLSRFKEAVDALQQWYLTAPKKLHYPFIFRCHAPSKGWLSGASNREVCWIGFVVYLADNGMAVEGGFESMLELQTVLAQFEGVPHFGKSFANDIFTLSKDLPNFEKFDALRKSVDPSGKFSNKWIDTLFTKGKARKSKL
jgi:FAD/FMN-containing dehydrogenase